MAGNFALDIDAGIFCDFLSYFMKPEHITNSAKQLKEIKIDMGVLPETQGNASRVQDLQDNW